MNVWITTGSSINLKTSLEKGKWGMNRRLKNTWDRVAKGDLLSSTLPALSAALWVSPVSRARLRRTIFSGVTRL